MVYRAAERFAALGGPSSPEAFEEIKVNLTQVAVSHAQLLVLRAAAARLEELQQQGQVSVHRILGCLFSCLALSWLDEHLADFLTTQTIHLDAHNNIKETLAAACKQARTTAVPVADAFGHSDNFLNSALGRSIRV